MNLPNPMVSSYISDFREKEAPKLEEKDKLQNKVLLCVFTHKDRSPINGRYMVKDLY